MYTVYHATIVGNRRSGKSALCQQWSGAAPTSTYVASFLVEDYTFGNIIVLTD